MAFLTPLEPVTLTGHLVTLVPLAHDQHDGLLEALEDGQLWDRWYTSVPAPSGLRAEIDRLRRERNAVILAHYYQKPEIQDLADFVGDSLDLSRKAAATDADVIAFCGVRFMAEVAKILSPEKVVVLPDMNAGCSLEDSCPPEQFAAFRARLGQGAGDGPLSAQVAGDLGRAGVEGALGVPVQRQTQASFGLDQTACGGAAEVEFLGDGAKVAQVSQFHGVSLER